MQPALNIMVVLGIAISLASCEGGGGTTAKAPEPLATVPAVKAVEAAPVARVRRTTSSKIALKNLSAQINSFQRRIEALPNDIAAREMLVSLLLSRTQYLGSYEDFDTAFQVIDDVLERKLAPARGAVLHATILSAVHRFEEASAELDRAETLGAKNTQSARETIALARGLDVVAITKARQAVASEYPSYASLTKLAAALTKAERYEEADAAYQKALDLYRDVSPFPIAWVAFQRGVLWGELADDPERAYEQYQIAVERLPEYIVGNVHLSELEVERGERAGAIARLEAIVDTTVDPEPASRLAEYIGEPERAKRYREQADVGYKKLLERYPLAFADHATEFYLGSGNDPERALKLAQMNLSNRKTGRAYRLAIEAATAAKQQLLVCELSKSAGLDTPPGC